MQLCDVNACSNLILNLLFQHELFTSTCIYVFTDDFSSELFFDNSPNIVNIKLPNQRIIIDDYMIFNNYGCRSILIKNQYPVQVFRQFEALIRNESNVVERFNRRRYVLWHDQNTKEDLNDIFDLHEIEHVTDILLIELENENIKTNLLLDNNSTEEPSDNNCTATFFSHKFSGNNPKEKVIIDKWFSKNCSFLYSAELFPDKFVSLDGKTLRFMLIDYRPFSVYDEENGYYDGVETSFGIEYANYHNATVSFLCYPDLWGTIYDNWTGTGIVGHMAQDRADFSFGALYRWLEDYPYLDFSTFLLKSGIRIYVPGPRLASGWFLPSYSFSSEVWGVVLFIYLFCSIFLYFLSTYYGHYKKSLINDSKNYLQHVEIYVTNLFITTSIFLEQPLNNVFQGRSFKIFIFALIVQCLLISSFYNSGYSATMAVPRYEGVIKSIQDFADSDLHWGATSGAWIEALKTTDDEKYKTIVQKYRVADSETLIEYGRQRKFGYPLERMQFGHFAFLEYHADEILPYYRITYEDLNWDLCVSMLRKHSVYLPSFDNFVRRIYESGILAYWENQVTYKYMDNNKQNIINFFYYNHETEHSVVQLSWNQIQGAFALLFLGLAAASFSFIMENFVYKRPNSMK